MTNPYTFTNNPTLNGISICDTDILNDDIMHLKWEQEHGSTRLHALKSYKDEGELLTDSEGLTDVKEYAHSSFDLSKFTVVGTPIVTDDGIVSQTDWETYVSTSTTIDFSKRVVIKEKFEFNSKTFSSNKWVLRIGNIGGLFFRSGYMQTLINSVYSNDVSSSVYTVNEPIYLNWVIDGTSSVCTLTQNNNTIATLTSTITALSSSYTINLIGAESDTSDKNNGSADLKQFSVTEDGVEVFSGNKTGTDSYTINNSTVTIPYTLTKTGSKIVNSAYRTQVTSVYNAQGYAPYYTLSDTDFTLPMGELYGMMLNQSTPHIVERYENGYSWYRVWSDGWCEQGGRASGTINGTSGGVEQIALLKSFGNTNYYFNTVCERYSSTDVSKTDDVTLTINAIANNTIDVYLFDVGGNSYTVYFRWEAKGYIS